MRVPHTILIIFLLLFTCIVAFSQDDPSLESEDYSILDNEDGTSMVPIIMMAYPGIEELENQGMEIVRMEFDILTDVKTSYRELHEGYSYGIMAFGDYRFADIDVTIYKEVDGTWAEIQSDASTESIATVVVEPSSTGSYRIDIKAYTFVEGYSAGHYGLIIFHN